MEGTEQSPIMEARAMRLFPTVVWRAEIRPHACRRINEAIVAKLAALRRGMANPTAGRGWQSGHDLHKLHELRELTESIDVTVRDILDYLRYRRSGVRDHRLLGQHECAGRRTRAPQPSQQLPERRLLCACTEWRGHHQFSRSAQPDGDSAAARRRAQRRQYGPGGRAGGARARSCCSRRGLPHSVDANRGDRDRISVSFNVMLSGYAAQLSKPLWQAEGD